MNSSPSPYLNVTRSASTQRGINRTSSWVDVHTFDRPDAVGELEDLRLAERLGREPAPLPLVDHRWVEALLDRGPDRERRGEVVPGHLDVGAVPYAEFGDV